MRTTKIFCGSEITKVGPKEILTRFERLIDIVQEMVERQASIGERVRKLEEVKNESRT